MNNQQKQFTVDSSKVEILHSAIAANENLDLFKAIIGGSDVLCKEVSTSPNDPAFADSTYNKR